MRLQRSLLQQLPWPQRLARGVPAGLGDTLLQASPRETSTARRFLAAHCTHQLRAAAGEQLPARAAPARGRASRPSRP